MTAANYPPDVVSELFEKHGPLPEDEPQPARPTETLSFIISSAILFRHVKALLPVVKANPIVPILENVCFSVDAESVLTLTVSDLRASLVCTLPVEVLSTLDGFGRENGFCINARRLYKLLSGLPEQPVTIVFNGDKKVTIQAETGSYNFFAENRLDWPKLPTLTEFGTSQLNGKEFARVFRQTLPFTSNDDLRPAMTGVYFHENQIAGTDGHRLVSIGLNGSLANQDGLTPQFILPYNVGTIFLKAFGKSEEDVTLDVSKGNARFTWANFTLIGRTIDERFPDYESAIPATNPIEVTVNRTALIRLIDRVYVFASKVTHMIVLTANAGASRLTVAAENKDEIESCSEYISASVTGEVVEENFNASLGDVIEIGFNARLLIETLKHIPGSHVQLRMSTSRRACVMHPHDGEPDTRSIFLQMPVMLERHNY